MTYLEDKCTYIRTEEEEEIQRRSSACSQQPPQIDAGRKGDPTPVIACSHRRPHADARRRMRIFNVDRVLLLSLIPPASRNISRNHAGEVVALHTCVRA